MYKRGQPRGSNHEADHRSVRVDRPFRPPEIRLSPAQFGLLPFQQAELRMPAESGEDIRSGFDGEFA